MEFLSDQADFAKTNEGLLLLRSSTWQVFLFFFFALVVSFFYA